MGQQPDPAREFESWLLVVTSACPSAAPLQVGEAGRVLEPRAPRQCQVRMVQQRGAAAGAGLDRQHLQQPDQHWRDDRYDPSKKEQLRIQTRSSSPSGAGKFSGAALFPILC